MPMLIGEIMSRDIQTIAPGDSVQKAASVMGTLDLGFLPVCDEAALLGVVTDRDITVRATAFGLDPESTHVAQIMTAQTVSCSEDDRIDDVMKIMGDAQVRRLPVLSREGEIVGIVSLGDLATESGDREKSGEVLQDISEPSMPRR